MKLLLYSRSGFVNIVTKGKRLKLHLEFMSQNVVNTIQEMFTTDKTAIWSSVWYVQYIVS